MKTIGIYVVFVFSSVLCFSVDAAAQKGSSAVKEGIVRQLIAEGEFESDCADGPGGASQLIDIKPVDLNSDGKPEYFVEGASGCGMGMRSAKGWVFEKSGNGYRMLFSAGEQVGMKKRTRKTKGYFDIGVSYRGSSADWEPAPEVYRFNGSVYK